jgi:predicted NUDIX family NTP pyrophosphohydrolase
MYRRRPPDVEVFLVHPGGPYWAKKDFGSWSIPKGEYLDGEEPLETAEREFREETGSAAAGDFVALGQIQQPGGKIVTAWALEGDLDPATLISNTCWIEWPPRSGRQIEIPEVDRGAWFTIESARERISKGQIPLLDRLQKLLSDAG